MNATSPTPWRWITPLTSAARILDANGDTVITDGSSDAERGPAIDAESEDARLIVLAINSHDALLAACKAAARYDAALGGTTALAMIRAAIALAEGGAK